MPVTTITFFSSSNLYRMRQARTLRRNPSDPRRLFISPENGSSHISENVASMADRSVTGRRRHCRLARLAITKAHFMPKLVRGPTLAALVLIPANSYRLKVARFGLFLQPRQHRTGGTILHRLRQLA